MTVLLSLLGRQLFQALGKYTEHILKLSQKIICIIVLSMEQWGREVPFLPASNSGYRPPCWTFYLIISDGIGQQVTCSLK
jgi:hypothetical protein